MPENFSNRYQTALAAGVTSGAATGTVTSVTGIPAYPFRAIISSEGANTDEIVLVTLVAGTTLTWTRAAEAVAGVQAASAHGIGATFTAIVTATQMTALSASVAISALPAVTVPASTDEFIVNQGGTSKKVTLAQITGLLAPYSRVVLQTPDLVSYWPAFTGTTAVDVIGGNHGTYVSGPTLNVRSAIASTPGAAMTLNGSTQWVTAPTVGLPTGSADRTVMGWFKTSSAGWIYLLAYGTSGADHDLFSVYLNSGVFTINNWTENRTFGSGFNNGAWHHFAASLISNIVRVYVDGVLTGAPSNLSCTTPASSTLYLGSNLAGSAGWVGSLDSPAFWSRGLTSDEVVALHAAGIA